MGAAPRRQPARPAPVASESRERPSGTPLTPTEPDQQEARQTGQIHVVLKNMRSKNGSPPIQSHPGHQSGKPRQMQQTRVSTHAQQVCSTKLDDEPSTPHG